jgi:hypothetical protein
MSTPDGKRRFRPGTLLGALALALLVAAACPYWPCPRCERSGRVHRVDGATMAPSDFEQFTRFVRPREHAVETCADCDGRGRCAGWRSLRHRLR